MRIACICMIVLLLPIQHKAQFTGDNLTDNFAFSVHSIDDFFDRFDFRRNTGLEKYVKKNYPNAPLTRKLLITHLFNAKNNYFNDNKNVAEFVSDVTDSIAPKFVNYVDNDWYAELQCKVFYKNKPQNLKLILKVESSRENSFRWSVVSAKANFLSPAKRAGNTPVKRIIIPVDMDQNTFYCLSPVSHGIDFTNLDKIFINKAHVSEYIYKGVTSAELTKLISLIQSSQLKYQQVNRISYHLLQIEGWIVSVDYFNRNEKNSGWLINNLMKATKEEKRIFLKTQLHIMN